MSESVYVWVSKCVCVCVFLCIREESLLISGAGHSTQGSKFPHQFTFPHTATTLACSCRYTVLFVDVFRCSCYCCSCCSFCAFAIFVLHFILHYFFIPVVFMIVSINVGVHGDMRTTQLQKQPAVAIKKIEFHRCVFLDVLNEIYKNIQPFPAVCVLDAVIISGIFTLSI